MTGKSQSWLRLNLQFEHIWQFEVSWFSLKDHDLLTYLSMQNESTWTTEALLCLLQMQFNAWLTDYIIHNLTVQSIALCSCADFCLTHIIFMKDLRFDLKWKIWDLAKCCRYFSGKIWVWDSMWGLLITEKQWPQSVKKITNWIYFFFIYHWISGRKSTAVFIPLTCIWSSMESNTV